MKSEHDINDLATRREAARYLRTTEPALRRWERQRKGPPVVRLSPRVALYRWEDLRAFLKASLKMSSALHEASPKFGMPMDEA